MFRNNENIFLLLFKKQSVHNTEKVLAINKEEPDSSATAGEGWNSDLTSAPCNYVSHSLCLW